MADGSSIEHVERVVIPAMWSPRFRLLVQPQKAIPEVRIVRKKRELLRTRCTTGAPSEEWRRVHCVGGRGRSFQAEVVPGALGGDPAPGRPLDEPALQQKGLVCILDR